MGDLCKAELKGLGDCLEVSQRQESRMRFQQCAWWSLRSQTQGCPLLQPPTSFPVTTFGISQLPWASRACQHHFLSFVLYYQLAVSSQTHQSCYTKMENMVNVPLRASRTSLSRASILNADDAALVGEGRFSTNCSRRGTKYLLKGKTGTMAGPSSGRCKSLPRMRAGKTQEPR